MIQLPMFEPSVTSLVAHPAPGGAVGSGLPTPAKPARNVRTGQQLKVEGQKRALDHSGDEWRETVLACLKNWSVGRGPFRFEQFRGWWEENNGRAPASHKAWGGITSAAVRAGIIKWTERYEPARSQATHGHPVKVWVAV